MSAVLKMEKLAEQSSLAALNDSEREELRGSSPTNVSARDRGCSSEIELRAPPNAYGWRFLEWAMKVGFQRLGARGHGARYTLIALARHADKHAESRPSQRQIRELTGLKIDTIRQALRKLEREGLIRVDTSARDRHGRMHNRYQLLIDGSQTKTKTKTKTGDSPSQSPEASPQPQQLQARSGEIRSRTPAEPVDNKAKPKSLSERARLRIAELEKTPGLLDEERRELDEYHKRRKKAGYGPAEAFREEYHKDPLSTQEQERLSVLMERHSARQEAEKRIKSIQWKQGLKDRLRKECSLPTASGEWVPSHEEYAELENKFPCLHIPDEAKKLREKYSDKSAPLNALRGWLAKAEAHRIKCKQGNLRVIYANPYQG